MKSYEIDVNGSPHIDVRALSTASPEKYYQILGGLLDENRFEVSLTHHTNVTRNLTSPL